MSIKKDVNTLLAHLKEVGAARRSKIKDNLGYLMSEEQTRKAIEYGLAFGALNEKAGKVRINE